MKGSKTVVDVLNEALGGEIVAINQYFMHARMARHRGFSLLAERIQEASMDQMKHAELLIDRILFLGGTPELQPTENAQIGQTIPEQLQNDLELENHAIERLNSAIAFARKKGDNTSAALLCKILAHEEDHAACIQTHLGLIEDLGEKAYLQTQIRA